MPAPSTPAAATPSAAAVAAHASGPWPRRRRLGSLLLAGAGLLGGCVVVPAGGHGRYGGAGPVYGDEVLTAPPAPRQEYIGVAPVVGWVWLPGYWAWQANRYVWVGGRWSAPQPGHHWEPHSWRRDGRGWRQYGGRWVR